MEPSMAHGDHLLVAPRAENSRSGVRAGDVVVVRHPLEGDKVLVKRLERIDEGGLWLKGDNLQSTDSRHFGHANWRDLVGRVTAHIGGNNENQPGGVSFNDRG